MFTNYLEIEPGTRLFYKVYGSTKDAQKEIDPEQPTLIFLHGGPGVVDHTLYEPFWSKFSVHVMGNSTLQVIFIDQRGCGKSYIDRDNNRDYGDPNKWTLEQWGKDVHTFFTRFNIQKPIIAGVSFGGAVAMSCAVQFPTELGGLILCDTDARFDLDEIVNQFAKKVRKKGGDNFEVEKVCNAAKAMFIDTTQQTYANYVSTCIPYCATNPYNPNLIAQCVKNEKAAFFYNKNELTKYNFLPDLVKIECKTLVMGGDQNPVHNAESAKKTAEAIKPEQLTFEIFYGAGSPVYADKEKEATALIDQFLSKLPMNQMTNINNTQNPKGSTHVKKF